MFVKKVWYFVNGEGILIYRVLKGKYFKNFFFLEVYWGGGLSYLWRSIWGEKLLLLEELKWCVGCGYEIIVWNDLWLFGNVLFFVFILNINMDLDLLVNELIDSDLMIWKDDVVCEMFLVDEVVLIFLIFFSI